METFRCPTCLTLLEGGEPRCPACRSRLSKKRGQPIVLGESNRIAARTMLALDRDVAARSEALRAEERRRRRVADATHGSGTGPSPRRTRVTEPAEVEAELVWIPEPEPIPQFVDLTKVIEPDPLTATIDLTRVVEPAPLSATGRKGWAVIEPVGAPEPDPVLGIAPAPLARIGEDVHEIFEALHRKARAQDSDEVPEDASASRTTTPRSLRLLSSRAHRRPGWSLEFRGRAPGDNDS